MKRQITRSVRKFYAYSDAFQMEIEASSLEEAAQKAGIPSQAMLDDGAFLVVRDEETMEEVRYAAEQEACPYCGQS